MSCFIYLKISKRPESQSSHALDSSGNPMTVLHVGKSQHLSPEKAYSSNPKPVKLYSLFCLFYLFENI